LDLAGIFFGQQYQPVLCFLGKFPVNPHLVMIITRLDRPSGLREHTEAYANVMPQRKSAADSADKQSPGLFWLEEIGKRIGVALVPALLRGRSGTARGHAHHNGLSHPFSPTGATCG